MPNTRKILEQAITLPPAERAYIIDKLIMSLDAPDSELDKLWAAEAESRIDAYERDELKTVTLDKVLNKYR